ncbi:MAG TPA: oligosaccharide flippase family protein [Steroidobacteraceae bacterium]|nr:oligosaccharide flippase family protein [Steroidobacteraceae bacterium]
MASLSDKAAILIIGNACKYAVGFILPMVLVRYLSQYDYGTYQQLSLVANFCTTMMVLGLPTSVYYFYHHRADRVGGRATLVAQTAALLLVAGAVTGLVVALASSRLASRMDDPALRHLLPLYACYIGMYIAGEHFTSVFISQNRYVSATAVELGETVFRVVALVTLLSLGFGLQAIVELFVVYAAVRLLGRTLWLCRGRDSMLRASRSAVFARTQLAYSLPLAATMGVGVIGGMLDRAIVAVVFTPAVYAIYSVGALEIPLDSIFQASVLNVLRASLPALIGEGRIDEVVRIWRDSVRKLALIVVPCFIFLQFFSERFITTLFTQRYEESVHVFRIYLFLLPLHALVLSVVPQVFGRTRLNFYVAAVGVSSNVALSFLLLRVLGILGPATAMVFSSYLTATLYFVVAIRLVKAGPRRLLPLAALGRTTVAAAMSGVPALWAAAAVRNGLLGLALGGVVFSLAYLLCGYFLGIFTESEFRMARSWISRVLPASGP